MKIIILCLISLCVYSCITPEYEINEKLIYFAESIIKEPDKLKNLEQFYPEYYNKSYINIDLYDIDRLNKLIEFINNRYKISNKTQEKRDFNITENYLQKYFKTAIPIFVKDLICLDLIKDNIGIRYIWVKKENKYYICDIYKVILPNE